jgi:hypothetical protein
MLSVIMLNVVMLSVVAPFVRASLFSLVYYVLERLETLLNGTARLNNANNCLNTNMSSYLETSGGQSSNLYLNVVHIFNTSDN